MSKLLRQMQRMIWPALGALVLSLLGLQAAVGSPYVSTNMEAYPPNVGLKSAGAMMMLIASKDHTLFAPIYTDYEDLDGDGVMDNTYRTDFQYYGYFDARKCYAYAASYAAPNGQSGRFSPMEATVTGSFRCATRGRYWSGNFLNWATMTRIDVVRKLLYGGFRRADTASDTTLEMAQVSQDAHSFVKYYGGADIGDYAPFDADALGSKGLTICSRGSINIDPTTSAPGQPLIRLAKGNFSLWATIPSSQVCRYNDEGGSFSFGEKARSFYAKYGTDIDGVTIPAAQAHGTDLPSRSTDTIGGFPYEMAVRVQVCKSDMLGSENCQAYGSGTSVVYKPVGLLQQYGTSTQVTQAPKAEFGLITGSYDSPLEGGALRKNIGSLNDEVDPATGRFCYLIKLTTTNPSMIPSSCRGDLSTNAGIVATFDRIRLYDVGDYNARRSGFVLPSTLANGDFPSWGNPISEMYIQALNYLSGKWADPAGALKRDTDRDNGELGLPMPAYRDPLDDTTMDIASNVSRGTMFGHGICRKMMSLALSSSTVSYDTDDGGDGSVYNKFSTAFNPRLDPITNLTVAGWTDRIGNLEGFKNHTLMSVGSASGGFGADCTLKELGLGGVDSVGTYEAGLSAVSGVCPEAPAVKGSYLGAGAAFFARTNNIRSDASLTANTGADIDKTQLPVDALRVKSYAASLAGGVARIEVPVPGTSRFVTITPESLWAHDDLRPNLMPGAMLTFRAIGKQAPNFGSGFGGSGSYVVTWNDTQFAGDYDMDLVGFIRWSLTRVTGSQTEWELKVQTDVLNHNAGAKGSHGFSIIGTDTANSESTYKTDGKFITHGSNDFNAVKPCSEYSANSTDFFLYCSFTDATDWSWPYRIGGPNGDKVSFDDDSTRNRTTTVTTTFKVTAGRDSSAVTLREPLWYMAKYGAFDTQESTSTSWAERKSTSAVPAATSRQGTGYASTNWDSASNNSLTCVGANCGDGEPDGYFLARRPELLASRLNDLLSRELDKSNTAVSASSAQLVNGSYKYVATFTEGSDASYGNLFAYQLGTNGLFSIEAAWEGGAKLAAISAGNRNVITNVNMAGAQTGVAFTSALVTAPTATATSSGNYSADYLTALAGAVDVDAQATATKLIDYLRGDKAEEGRLWRKRPSANIMGPVVNSTPWVQDPTASARMTDGDFPPGSPSYAEFVQSRVTRNKVLWVGSDDGMLHGFHADTGRPMLSYVPSPVVSRLRSVFAVNGGATTALVDGAPFTADVLRTTGTTAWRTYLFGGLGRGGKAVFALDVTNTGLSTSAQLDSGDLSGAPSSLFKWIFTADDDRDLGYVTSAPMLHVSSGQAQQVVRLNNGRFGLLLPNGSGSADGKPVLFVLFTDGPGSAGWTTAATGRNYVKLTPRGNADANNGMMGVTWVDLDNNGTADVLYATDLLGRVWKFDIRSDDPANWASAFVRTSTVVGGGTATNADVPFFQANACVTATSGTRSCDTPAAITTNPVTTVPPFGGVMVSFGTGRALATGDFPNSSQRNRFISVWDKGRYNEDQIFPPPAATAGATSTFTAPNMPVLTDNEIGAFAAIYLRRTDGVDGQVYRVASAAADAPAVDVSAYTSAFNPASQDGWYFDFPTEGEQLISTPTGRRTFMSFTSVRPKSADEQARSCFADPLGTFYALDPSTGLTIRALLGTVLVNGVTTYVYGSSFQDQQVSVFGDRSKPSPGSAGSSSNSCGPGKIKARFLGQNVDKNGCIDAMNLRLQWREISGMKTK